MSVTGGVEMGSGLASSAALECAALGAILAATGRTPPSQLEQARIAQRAENEYVGAPTGLLDQLATLFGEARHALLDRLRRASPCEPVRVRPRRPRHHAAPRQLARHTPACGWRVRRPTRVVRAGGRRAGRLIAAGGAGSGTVGTAGGDRIRSTARRARHILTENQRVLDFVDALNDSDFAEVGRLLDRLARLDARRLRDHHRSPRSDRRHRGTERARWAHG